MTRSAAVTLALLLAGPAVGDDKPKPNTLTPKEIADGWLLLFDGETTFGWAVEGPAAVAGGKLVLGGDAPATARTTAVFGPGYLRFVAATPDGKPAAGGELTGPGRLRTPLAGLPGVTLDTTVGDAKRTADRFAVHVPAGQKLAVSAVAFRPAGLAPLFNGKDLAGWKVADDDPAKAKATFAVTPAGELHVKGGPGDIRTEKQFADFVLQTEVKTAGPTVNSGVFFRCVPGQVQNGYEAQVQNAVKDNDRTKPLDYGTGAIYRRVPARKVVANDDEWFTLTVVANGPHISTWVNGYPTVSWTDDRKPDDNPRKGLRTAAGHLSIQGHGPPMVADVLFRNLRIAELAAGKRE